MYKSLLTGTHVLSRSGRVSALVLAGIAALAMGCGGRPSSGQTTPRPRAAHGSHAGRDVVAAAGMPYRILRSKGGQEVAEAQFFDELAAAQAVCVAEVHVNPHHHWAQLRILDQLSQRGRRDGLTLALGMEMFQRPFQGILDDYAAGRIDESALLSRSGWEARWGYDFDLYRPMMRMAVERGLALLALNLPDELRKKVSRHGIEGLSAADRGKLPEVVLDDEAHRSWFEGLMDDMGGAHGHGHGEGGAHGASGHDASDPDDGATRAERIYSVQVLWDESMAEAAAAWLGGGADRRMVILAGSGHCHDSAIVRRMQRRGVGKVVSVRPMLDAGDAGEDVSAELAEPITDYLFVMSPAR
jgi:uncharacterized iron-regulated protein